MVIPKYVTESEVRVIVNKAFSDYEEKTGSVRHEQNSRHFQELFALVNKLKGAVIAVGAVLTGLKIYEIIVQLKH